MSSTSLEENKALFRRGLEEVINKHNLDAADQFYPPDYIQHNHDVPPGLAGVKDFFSISYPTTLAIRIIT